MLARHIFEHLPGTGVKIYHGVELTYGYKQSLDRQDGVIIRQGALLNDRVAASASARER